MRASRPSARDGLPPAATMSGAPQREPALPCGASQRRDRKAEFATQVAGGKLCRVIPVQLKTGPVLGLIATARKPVSEQAVPGLRDPGRRSLEGRDGVSA